MHYLNKSPKVRSLTAAIHQFQSDFGTAISHARITWIRVDLTRLSACSTIPAQKNVPSAIAVLPFVNLGSDPGQEGFCNDLTDNLINALSTLSDLKVAARNSSAPLRGTDLGLREIGDRLNVDAVLEGSVRTAAERIRVIVKLVSVQTGYPLWSDRYDRTFGDTFQIQHVV